VSKRGAVSEERRKLHNVELNEMGGVCGAYGGRRNIYRGLVREPVRKRTLLTTRRKWENIKMDRQYVDVKT